ncbi:hypothetical protein PLESTB_000833500 [Pleodorina starrii]|uniref:Cilium assembly protein DZIP1 N-terminal domain-containing protein n=1 Tax=Pleodorina starrii TaxID=330485 RepID=A0A9W6F2G0_9CHLO|nr:hypothetical protein PLESTM_000149300 [Pleodorina starrii]GLC54193.1 hypothetical protein PLESTB_000833500 [Pleodorina starrii]GLC64504.1 hypothetical protein PLESTF_000173200 [Pleodorina starrii]
MNTPSIVRSLAEQSEQLSRDLDSFSDRAFELQRLAKALQERSGRKCVDAAVQVETTAVGAPAYHLDRAKRLEAFSFQPFDRKVNWRKLRALNVDRVVRETDTRSLLDMYGDLACADLEKESVYDLTESNLLKLVRVMQLLLQHQQFQLEQGLGVQQLLREEQVSTLAALRMIPHLDVKGVGEGLGKLQGEFYKVADADMDAMFAQARAEERMGARGTLASNVDQVKQVLDLRAFGGTQAAASAEPLAAAPNAVTASAAAAMAAAPGGVAPAPAAAAAAATSLPQQSLSVRESGRAYARLSAMPGLPTGPV